MSNIIHVHYQYFNKIIILNEMAVLVWKPNLLNWNNIQGTKNEVSR